MHIMSSPVQGPEAALRFLSFAGFQKVLEKDPWEDKVQPGGKYYFSRNQASLVAFTLPQKWKQGAGVSVVATHVDSPNLKVRPVSKRTKEGYLQVGVETYGGGIWHSWLDRDLSLAGRVVTSHADGFKSKLVKIDKPILRIPTLAIHLDRNVNESFKFNQETEFVPILGQIASQLNESTAGKEPVKKATSVQDNHHPALLSLLANELSVAPEEIHDFELSLYDTQPSVLGGLNSEFIFSPRMDNLFSSFCAVEALAQSVSTPDFQTLEGNVNCITLFNHEEIGSVSTSGAESSLLPSLINRLSPSASANAQSISKSFLVSADMGHALHPNFTSKHEDNHKPSMNGGVVIKTNAKQRYASDAVTSFMEYEVRNDMACGSTVGPMLSKMGIKTCDVGCAMLSMHSIRETAGSHDIQNAIDLFRSLFESYAELERNLVVD
ncbi:aspartyl aminopeptidase [Mycena latifolia]|nr:aspartyl aminopeptidase [Mycena latifolia]